MLFQLNTILCSPRVIDLPDNLDAPGVDAGANGDRRERVYTGEDSGEDKRGAS